MVNYLSIKSTLIVNRPGKIYFYCDAEPSGQWWEKIKTYVEIVRYRPLEKIFGIPIKHPAHKADVARLEILLKKGGVYLDTDIICHKPFTPFLNYPVVLGEERRGEKSVGICSAVILAEKNAIFLQRWLEGFDPKRSLWKGFRSTGFDLYYAEMTTRYAKFLSTIYLEEVEVVGYKNFFYPTYADEDLHKFYETDEKMRIDEAFCYHLWGNSAWDSYLAGLTEEKIRKNDTNFARVVYPFLPL